jgi:hypothetical protein
VDDEVVRELTEAMKTTATQLGATRRTIADWERRGGNAGEHLSIHPHYLLRTYFVVAFIDFGRKRL